MQKGYVHALKLNAASAYLHHCWEEEKQSKALFPSRFKHSHQNQNNNHSLLKHKAYNK